MDYHENSVQSISAFKTHESATDSIRLKFTNDVPAAATDGWVVIFEEFGGMLRQ